MCKIIQWIQWYAWKIHYRHIYNDISKKLHISRLMTVIYISLPFPGSLVEAVKFSRLPMKLSEIVSVKLANSLQSILIDVIRIYSIHNWNIKAITPLVFWMWKLFSFSYIWDVRHFETTHEYSWGEAFCDVLSVRLC